ncbi:MAG: 30S ribosomal protein S17 [Thermoproteota archaeon]|nr:30S ribosomal protein S17 [Thermoproteota archaeon]
MVRNIGISVTSPRKTCSDPQCVFHGYLPVRGKSYSGLVVSSKSNKMVVVAREYPHPVPKYKRLERSRSKVHAYLPPCISAKEGQQVKIAECRPLSKTVSFTVIEAETNGS